jgi:hypothetical protein
MTAQPSTPQTDISHTDDYQPPVTPTASAPDPITPPAPVAPPTSVVTPPSEKKSSDESLQDQNIFFLLGVDEGGDDAKEAFLDELQQVIWEDFIENDTKMLISEEEMTQLRQLMAKGDSQDLQEEMVVYLEKLIPDLEEIMLEKALELKEDMVWERISGMRVYYVGKPESLTKIDEAEQLAKEGQWHQAAEVLNAISK